MYYKVTVYMTDTTKDKLLDRYPEMNIGDAISLVLDASLNPKRKRKPVKRAVGRPRKADSEIKLYPGIRKREFIKKYVYDTLFNGPVPTEKIIAKAVSLGITERSLTYVMANHIPSIKHGNQLIGGKKVWCSWLNKP